MRNTIGQWHTSKWGNYGDAKRDYNDLIKITPEKEDLYINRGIAHVKLEDSSAAHRDFSKAIKLDPKSAIAYYNRASVNITLKNNKEACKDMKSAAKLGYKKAFDAADNVCAAF